MLHIQRALVAFIAAFSVRTAASPTALSADDALTSTKSTYFVGQLCNVTSAYSLSFTCTGPGCAVLKFFKSVNCSTIAGGVRCSNGIACAGKANYKNGFNFLYDGDQQVQLYDTYSRSGSQVVSRSQFVTVPTLVGTTSASTSQPGHTITKTSSTSTSTSLCEQTATPYLGGANARLLQRSLNEKPIEHRALSKRANYQAIAKHASHIFQNGFFLPTNPDQALAKSLADALVESRDALASGKVPDLEKDAVNIILSNVLPNAFSLVNDTEHCEYEQAVADGISDVGQAVINDLAETFAPETLGASLFIVGVSHAAVGAAVNGLFNVVDDLLGHTRAKSCSTTSSISSTSTSSSQPTSSSIPSSARPLIKDPTFSSSCTDKYATPSYPFEWFISNGPDNMSAAYFTTDPVTQNRALMLQVGFGVYGSTSASPMNGEGPALLVGFQNYTDLNPSGEFALVMGLRTVRTVADYPPMNSCAFGAVALDNENVRYDGLVFLPGTTTMDSYTTITTTGAIQPTNINGPPYGGDISFTFGCTGGTPDHTVAQRNAFGPEQVFVDYIQLYAL